MQTTLDANDPDNTWAEMGPLLDEMMGRLRGTDRDALVLRYFENKSLQEVGAALGVHERAAQKRVARGLERLRGLFMNRGVALSVGAIAAALSAHAVEAAPAGLTAASLTALKTTVGSASIVGLADGGAKLMGWAAVKLGLLAGGVVMVPLICATLVVPKFSGKPVEVRRAGEMAELAEVAAFDLFTNAPARFRPGPYFYFISGSSSMDVSNRPIQQFQARAEWFVPRVSGRLSTLEIALQQGQPGRIHVSVARDDSGRVGKVLERFANVSPPGIPAEGNSHQGPTLVVSSKAHPQLLAGAKYWLCIEPADPTTYVLWWPTWFPLADDFLDAMVPGKWRFEPAGPQRPAVQVPLKRDYTKGAFAVKVRVLKEQAVTSGAQASL